MAGTSPAMTGKTAEAGIHTLSRNQCFAIMRCDRRADDVSRRDISLESHLRELLGATGVAALGKDFARGADFAIEVAQQRSLTAHTQLPRTLLDDIAAHL